MFYISNLRVLLSLTVFVALLSVPFFPELRFSMNSNQLDVRPIYLTTLLHSLNMTHFLVKIKTFYSFSFTHGKRKEIRIKAR